MALTRSAARAAARTAVLALAATALVGVTGATAHAEDAVAGGLTAAPADTLFPHQGNSGYDVSHYDIKFKIDIGVSSTSGAAATTTLSDSTTTIQATTTGAPLSSFSLDFQGTTSTLANSSYNVDAVTVNGQPASFERIENTTTSDATTDEHKLVITPTTPVQGAFTAVVTTSGRPVIHTDTDGSLEGWNNTVDGASFVNQPIGSMTLFPNNNTPRDKATYTWTVDAPTKSGTSTASLASAPPYQVGVVSNGELTSRKPNDDGSRTTWVWDQKVPQASELALFSIGRYDIYTSDITLASGRTIPEWTFIDPAIPVSNQTTTLGTRAQLKQMIDFYESKYGPYPGNSTGLVTDNTTGINYALETQDRPFSPTSASRGTTYHEIMHQWFGDNVSPYDWNDIWLNEGPATYSETQFPYEGAGSSTTSGETSVFNSWNSTAANSSLWSVPVAAMTKASQLFGSPTYTRGNMTLHALRTAIGADTFASLMHDWQTTNSGHSKKTADFIELAEELSGRDLTSFFNTWVYTTGKPAWPVKFNLDLAGPTAQVNGGDAVTYTLSARNTGKVAMPAGGTSITVDVSDVLDDAAIGTLPGGVTLDGSTLTWSVPATALAATSSVSIPFTVNADTTGRTLTAVARAATLGGTCVSCTASTVVGTAPIPVAPAPTIDGLTSGAPVVGQPLTANTAGWDSGTTFTYQWFVDGTPVLGATSASWTPTLAAVGFPVTVKVTGTQAGHLPTSAASAATSNGVRGTMTTATPTISGSPKVGEKLTVDPGAWQAGTVFTYQWRANKANISGATGPVYSPTAASQVGQTIDVVVTGTRAGYTTSAQTSAATDVVAKGTQVLQPTPTITGTPRPGTTVTGVQGAWDGGTTRATQWLLDGTPIDGATDATYTPTVDQIGRALTFRVTSTRAAYDDVVKASDPVTVLGYAQTLTPTPTISGTPKVGVELKAEPGTWDEGTTQAFQWKVDGDPIDGATSATYRVGAAVVGEAITVTVTSTKPTYETVSRTSDPTTAVVEGALETTPEPTITGTPQVGRQLTAVPGTWDSGVTLAYQWNADGQPVDGATAATFVPAPSRAGAVITVTVTGTKAGYTTVSRTSAATAAVAKGDLGSTPVPTVTGTPKVGVELTAVPGTWDSGVALSYQWFAGEDAIEGATESTYTPTADQAGEVITLAVTGTKAGFAPVTRTSAPTAPVADGDLDATPAPTLSGTPKVGVEVTAVPGTWDQGVALSYQWYAGEAAVEGATGDTYTPTAEQAGEELSVRVTGTKAGYAAVTESSEAETIAAGDLVLTPAPALSGTARVGGLVTAAAGTWDQGTTLAYRWTRNGVTIPGATTSTYRPVVADFGRSLAVVVTGSKDGYTAVSRTSAARSVAAGTQTRHGRPVVTGKPKVGRTLGVRATYDAGTSVTYTWLANGRKVGAKKTLKVTRGMKGKRISVRVTVKKTGYVTLILTSAPTAKVVK